MRRLSFAVAAWIAWLGLSSTAWALPDQFMQEGLAIDRAGAPIVGQHAVRIRLWGQAQGGAAIFDETHQTELFEGYYAVAVGSIRPIDRAIFRGDVWLSVTLDNGAELLPRIRLTKVPAAFLADVALDAIGDIHPRTVSIGANPVIDANGRWVGNPAGLQGPAGPVGPAGPQGPVGPAGGQGQAGSPDTPEQVRDKLRQVDGAGSQIDADLFDGLDSNIFVRTAQQVLDLLRGVDGAGSGVDADRLDGFDSSEFLRTAAQILERLITVDGSGSGLDADRLDGFDSGEFVRTAQQVLALLLTVDGSGSGLDADRLDGLDSTQFLRADANLRVQGDLEVGGRLIVGQPVDNLRVHNAANDPGPCDPAHRGQVYFNTTTSQFMGCNGAAWVPLGQEVVPPSPPIVYQKGFGDTRLTPDGWQDLPGRVASYRKSGDNTLLYVQYQDMLGYHMVGQSWGCRWRLTMNNQPIGRPFSSHTSTARGWRINPHTLQWWLPGVRSGDYEFRVQVYRPNNGSASECLAGWPDGFAGNFLAFQEKDASRVTITRNMFDTRHTPNDWQDLPGRAVTFDKRDAATVLKVDYTDDLGYHMVGHSWGCRWRLTLDGNAIGRPMSSHTSTAGGWRIQPSSLLWVLEGIGVGRHTARIQVYRPNGGSASECLAGWPGDDTENSLVVEETSSAGTAIARNFGDTRLTPNTWVDLPGRQVAHVKAARRTPMRVTYMDDLGYHMVGHSWGCRWLLTVDGQPVDEPFSSHSGTVGGWRIDPKRLVWILPGVEPGAHTYRVQVYNPGGGASECLAGWPDQDTNNLLLVEEITMPGEDGPAPPLQVISFNDHFHDTRLTPNDWVDIPDRVLLHRKRDANAVLAVTHHDNLGYHMVGHSWGCRWRLTRNGAPIDRPFSSHTSTAGGWRIHPSTHRWYLEGLPVGDHVFRVQVYRPNGGSASECLAGWPWNETHNYIAAEEIPPNRIAIRRHMNDTRHTPNGWEDIPNREVIYNKAAADSVVRVDYMDDLGYHMVGHSWGCRWRLTMDGNAIDRPFSGHTSTRGGWRIDPMLLSWVLQGVPAGQHRFRVQVYRPNAGSASECLAGWPDADTGNSLVVTELANQGIALRRHMSDTRFTPDGWADLPQRELSFDKVRATSQLRITYQDDLGYHMVGHSWGCRWRLTRDGVPVPMNFSSHTSTAPGWRINPSRLEWILPNVPVGLATWRIQVYRPNGGSASECLAGWPDGDTGNLLMIQEL